MACNSSWRSKGTNAMPLAVLVAVSILIQLCSAQQAFLQSQLPLKVLVATPSELASDAAASSDPAVTLTGRQAITAVFSRPVVALGADWGSESLQDDLVPFTLSCGTPGRLRWVTTNIARFDPSVDWPTDLECTFQWNKALKTYDGAPLQLGDLQPSVRLQTQPLTMNVQQVQSAAATAATGDQWSAFMGSPDDRLPEVPPDANITLSFSYPVELSQLAKSLKLVGSGTQSSAITISPCPAMSPIIPLPLAFTAKGVEGVSSSSPAELLKLNSTCAVVKFVPGLEAGAAAVLRLPKGARYSPVAGPATQDIDINVYGLRPFRIPLRWDFMNRTSSSEQLYNGVTYRRLTMWLPHGLQSGTTLPSIKAAMRLCCLADPYGSIDGSCSDQTFWLSRPAPAVLSMLVPALNPGQRCVIRIKDDSKVKDGFGLPLQASSNVWWTQDLDVAFTGPSVRQVALLEPAAGNPTLEWPWVSRGTPEEGMNRVQAVNIPVTGATGSSSSSGLLEQAIAGVLAGYGGAASSILNTAGVKASRQAATWPTFQSLALSGKPGISLVGSCCRQVSWPSPREVLGTSALVVQSDLQAAFIEQAGQLVAWVTTTQGQSKPVEGARVQVYATVYGKDSATPGQSCVTSSDGTCVIDMTVKPQQKASPSNNGGSAFPPSSDSASYTAVVTAAGHGPLVVPDLPNSVRYRSSTVGKEYSATLVLDRKLVKPGDDLHVTGYIQRKEGAKLRVAQDLDSVVLQISPGFDRPASSSGGSSRSSNPLRITAKVDTTLGTVHAVIPVPRNATPANYNLQMWTSTPPSGADNAPMDQFNAPIQISEGVVDVAVPRPISTVVPKSGPVPATASIALANAAADNVQAIRSAGGAGRRLQQYEQAPIVQPESTDAGDEADSTADILGVPSDVQEEPMGPDPAAAFEEPPAVTLEPAVNAALPLVKPMPGQNFANAPLPPLGASLAFASFTVGDPRPPTASLVLSTQSNWVKPDGSVAVSVTTKSYVGSDVSGAEVTLKWSTGKAEGEQVLKTNASGMATGVVDFGKVPQANRSEVGSSVTLKATWIGPTREPLMQSKTVKIADGAVRVELQRTLVTNVPGIAFGVKADAFSMEDDSPFKGAIVEVSLTPFNATTGLSSCTAAQQATLAQQKCSIKSGDPDAARNCQITLPCAGDFVLKGCIRSSGSSGGSSSDGGCSKGIRLGRNMTTWLASPWSSGPGQLVLLPDKTNVSLGDDVALTVQNPFWGPVSGLVVWGNGEQREQFHLQVPPGPSTIVIQKLGPECSGGCNVVVTLAVARPTGLTAKVEPRSNVGIHGTKAAAPLSNTSGTSQKADTKQGSSQTAAPGAQPQKPSSDAVPKSSPGTSSTPASKPQPAQSSPATDKTGSGFTTPATPATPRGLSGNAASGMHSYRFGPVDFNILGGAQQRPRVGFFAGRSQNGRNLLQAVVSQRNAAAPRATSSLPDIPRSALYDPYAPITVSALVTLTLSNQESLTVDVTVKGQSKDAAGTAVLAPQSKQGSITVSVKDAAGAAVSGAEVTLMVVDKAVLDLMPYELQDVSGAMQPKLRAAFSMLHLNALRVTRSAINATFSALQRRLLSVDPWLPVDTQVSHDDSFGSPMEPSGEVTWLPPAASVDVPDDVYLKTYTTALTPMPYRACPAGELNCPHPPTEGHSHGLAENMSEMTMVAADAAPAPMAAAVPKAMAAPALARASADGAGANNAANAGSSRNAGSAAAAGAQLRLQADFKVTPLFKVVKTGADGKVTVDFPAPDNLGRFVVRAYVARAKTASSNSGGGNSGVVYGGAESDLIVRRTVSLVPSLPRQVRVGDSFTAGVLVEAPGTVSDVIVTVTAALIQQTGSRGSSKVGTLRLGSDSFRTVTLTPGKPQQEVRFDFDADAIGIQNITFSAAAGPGSRAANRGLSIGGVRNLKQADTAATNWRFGRQSAGAVADQVQLQVQVNGKQGDVVIATSFAVRASNSGNTWEEGMVLPHVEQGSGSISLVAGVGSLPAIQAAYMTLTDQGLDARCTPGSQAVALSLLPAFLSMYQQPGALAASMLTAQQVQLTQAATAAVNTKFTHQRYGLLSLDPACLSVGSRGPDRADIALNAWGAWLAQQALGRNSGDAKSGVLASGWSSVQSAAKTWAKALEAQLVLDAVAARTGSRSNQPGPYTDLEALSWARLVLGPTWNPTVPAPQSNNANNAGVNAGAKDVSADVKKDLSMDRLTAAALAGNLTVGGQARVGLALAKGSKSLMVTGANGQKLTAATAAERLSKRLISSIRVGGRTAYVATEAGARSAAGLSDQSMALAFLEDSAAENPLVQKLAAWVAQGAAPPPLYFAAVCVSTSPWDAGLRSAALATYDSSTASLTPDLKLTVVAQPKPSLTSKRAPATLLSAAFTSQEAGKVASSSKGWESVPSNSSLVFSAQGSGEVSIAAALNFTPADLLPFPTYRGLWVQRAVLVEQAAAGSSGSNSMRATEDGIALGKIVTVAVQVTSPDDQSDVTVEVLMPGGLEPLDPNVFKDADAATICGSSDDESPLSGSGSNNGGFGPARRNFGAVPMMLTVSGNGGFGGFWRPIWPICPVQTTAPDRVSFQFGYLRAGTHTMRFKAVAATSGTFVLPPVKAYVQQQPEVMGLSPAGSLTVCLKASEGCAGKQGAGNAVATSAKACPQDCNGNGACNLGNGVCICDSGFEGAACADLATE